MKLTLANLLNGSFLKNLMPTGAKSAGMEFSDVLNLSVKEAPPSGKPLSIADENSPPVAKPAVSFLRRYREANVESQVKLKLPENGLEGSIAEGKSDGLPVKKAVAKDGTGKSQIAAIETPVMVKTATPTLFIVSPLNAESSLSVAVEITDKPTRNVRVQEDQSHSTIQNKPHIGKSLVEPKDVASPIVQPRALHSRVQTRSESVPLTATGEKVKPVRPTISVSGQFASDPRGASESADSVKPRRNTAQKKIAVPDGSDGVEDMLPKEPQPSARRLQLTSEFYQADQKVKLGESRIPVHKGDVKNVIDGRPQGETVSLKSKHITNSERQHTPERQVAKSGKNRRESVSAVISSDEVAKPVITSEPKVREPQEIFLRPGTKTGSVESPRVATIFQLAENVGNHVISASQKSITPDDLDLPVYKSVTARAPIHDASSGAAPTVPLRKSAEVESTSQTATPAKPETASRSNRPEILNRDVAPLLRDYLQGGNISELKPLSLVPKLPLQATPKVADAPHTATISKSDVLPADSNAWVPRSEPKRKVVASESPTHVARTDTPKKLADLKTYTSEKATESEVAFRTGSRTPVEQSHSLADQSGEVSAKPQTAAQKGLHAPSEVTVPRVDTSHKHAQVVKENFEQAPAVKPSGEFKVSGTTASSIDKETHAISAMSDTAKTEAAISLEQTVDARRYDGKPLPLPVLGKEVIKDTAKPVEIVSLAKAEVNEAPAKHLFQPARPLQSPLTVESPTQKLPQAIPFVIVPDTRTALPATDRLFNKPVDRRDAQFDSDRNERSSTRMEQRSASPAREAASDAKQQSGADSQSHSNERETNHSGFRSALENVQPTANMQVQHKPHATGQQGMTESMRVALQQALDMSRKRVVEPNELRLTVPLGELGSMDIDVVREADKFLIRIGADPQALAIMEEQRPQLTQWLRDNGYPVEHLDVGSRTSDQARSDMPGSDQSREDRASNTPRGSRRSGEDHGAVMADDSSAAPRPSYSGARVWTA